MEYELHPASAADKETICSLNKQCYHEVVEQQFGSWDEDFQREHFEQKWGATQYMKIIRDGEMIGAMVLVEHDDHVFLSEIQIAPEHQGQGLGTRVVSDVVADAQSSGLPVRLRVLLRNRARAMYERLGFRVTGETETHFLMERLVEDNG